MLTGRNERTNLSVYWVACNFSQIVPSTRPIRSRTRAVRKADAVGVRIDEVPITPEKILKALEAKAAGKAPRYGPGAFPEVPWPLPLEVPPPWEGGDGKARKSEVRSPKSEVVPS